MDILAIIIKLESSRGELDVAKVTRQEFMLTLPNSEIGLTRKFKAKTCPSITISFKLTFGKSTFLQLKNYNKTFLKIEKNCVTVFFYSNENLNFTSTLFYLEVEKHFIFSRKLKFIEKLSKS
jgi:hypothetical protein